MTPKWPANPFPLYAQRMAVGAMFNYPVGFLEDDIFDLWMNVKEMTISGFAVSANLGGDPFFGAVGGAFGGVGGVIGGAGGGTTAPTGISGRITRRVLTANPSCMPGRFTGSPNNFLVIDFARTRANRAGKLFHPYFDFRWVAGGFELGTRDTGSPVTGGLTIEGYAHTPMELFSNAPGISAVLTIKVTQRYDAIEMVPPFGRPGQMVRLHAPSNPDFRFVDVQRVMFGDKINVPFSVADSGRALLAQAPNAASDVFVIYTAREDRYYPRNVFTMV